MSSDSDRVLITGGEGQLATDLAATFSDHDVHALGRGRLDIGDSAAIDAAMTQRRPAVVINTAAFHEVDRCENEPESAFLINAAAPQRLAAACHLLGALFVHISTDYVFDGTRGEPYVESDPVNPLSVYGASKAAGEMAVRATTPNHLIIRTSGLYGMRGRTSRHGNFVERMLSLAEQGRSISVVNDQVLTPSATVDVSAVIRELIHRGATGTFHVTNSGRCSWYEFARTIFDLSGVDAELRPTTQEEWATPARRPAFSVLAHDDLRGLGLPELRPWQEALAEYLQNRSQA